MDIDKTNIIYEFKRRKKRAKEVTKSEPWLVSDKEFYKAFKTEHLNKPTRDPNLNYEQNGNSKSYPTNINNRETSTKIHWGPIFFSLFLTFVVGLLMLDLPYQIFFMVIPITITTTYYTRR